MTVSVERSAETQTELIHALQLWRLSHERAGRYNRNLLQYGTGIAALLGIEAGSGGIFAMASALLNVQDAAAALPAWALATLTGVGIVGAFFLTLLSVLLFRTFVLRSMAEGEADRCLQQIIALAPEGFLPKVD